MKNNNQLEAELRFYNQAYSDNKTRIERGYLWPHTTSPSFKELIKRNNLNEGREKTALDVGCGDGRHIRYLTELGYTVTGVDFSENSIRLCKNRFYRNKKINILIKDLTEKMALEELGKFDLVLDWSVLDHIRKENLQHYLQNINCALNKGGHLLSAQFSPGLQGTAKNRDFKIVDGHYSKVYSHKALKELFSNLKIVDYINNSVETNPEKAIIKFNTILFKKV